ncbi:HAMP domain-containing sensor histidine kinase [Lacrimispora sp.]|uniref:HAMP domain-containing sensor histidine kinase n=1 Tax=Lacrimispora sp. TaxID=2719234 RepID=UPI0028A7B957|nr:HAMP domain-containing sensor histidine kinase [Lacrimispora sp.]
MKSMMKVLSRYVLSAAAVAVLLLVINATVLIVWLFTEKNDKNYYNISQTANQLTATNDGYELSQSGKTQLEQNQQWAMLLDQEGKVIWNFMLPADVPLTYSISDVAGFSRWYLKDYPVSVWRHDGGLLVVGSPKNSMWKLGIMIPQKSMNNLGFWVPFFLVMNCLTAIFLALIFGLRLFRSLKRLSNGVQDMTRKRPVSLPVNGVLGDLAMGINEASSQLILQEAALKKRDDARTTWIAGISHDIRTPLAVAMGYSSQLEEDERLLQEQRDLAGIVRRQCQRIKDLVSDLNLASKLEYDMQPLRKEKTPLAPLIRSVAVDIINDNLSDRHTLEVSIKDNAQNRCLLGDKQLLKRAVSNLILNSIKHNPEGCDITIELSMDGENFILSVTDNGTGFPEDVLQRVNGIKNKSENTGKNEGINEGENESKNLSRNLTEDVDGNLTQNMGENVAENSAETDSKKEQSGHGLGLTIVRQIINAHNGSAHFSNLSGGGCRVICYLPAISS